jgi:hypothetical protein
VNLAVYLAVMSFVSGRESTVPPSMSKMTPLALLCVILLNSGITGAYCSNSSESVGCSMNWLKKVASDAGDHSVTIDHAGLEVADMGELSAPIGDRLE